MLKAGLGLLSVFLLLPSSGWSAARELDHMAIEALENRQRIQALEQDWSREERQLLSRIESLGSATADLQLRLRKLEQMLEAETQRIAMQQRRLVESEKLRTGLQVWLQGVVQRLEASRDAGLPFLRTERQRRLQDLEVLLNDPYTPSYEQFRRIFEALLVEAEYGHSNEVYRAEIELDGEPTQVDLLRVGRLALFYRTLDRQGAGVFDPAAGRFTALPEGTLEEVSRAFRVVRREAAAEMTALPVGRIELP